MATRRPLRGIVLLVALVLSPAIPTTVAQDGEAISDEAELVLIAELLPERGEIDVTFRVASWADVVKVQLRFDGDEALVNGSSIGLGEGWTVSNETKDPSSTLLEVTRDPTQVPTARWTIDADALPQGGYLGATSALLPLMVVTPDAIVYSPRSTPPAERTMLIQAPAGWTVQAPHDTGPDGAFLTSPHLGGFAVAGSTLVEEHEERDDEPIRIIRIDGAMSPNGTDRVLEAGQRFYAERYRGPREARMLVIATDPFWEGGRAYGSAIAVHTNATASTVAHELAHAYSPFRLREETPGSSVWVEEGQAEWAAEQLMVASGLKNTSQAKATFARALQDAQQRHDVRLDTISEEMPSRRAAYTKGWVVLTALEERVHRATSQRWSLPDVLAWLAERPKEPGRPSVPACAESGPISSQCFEHAIGTLTGWNASGFFDAYVRAPAVPPPGPLFPAGAAVRLAGVDPARPCPGTPVEAVVAMTNRAIEPTRIHRNLSSPTAGPWTLTTTLAPLEHGLERVALGERPVGAHSVRMGESVHQFNVEPPSTLAANLSVAPTSPRVDEPVSLTVHVERWNPEQVKGAVEVTLDGEVLRAWTPGLTCGETAVFRFDGLELSRGRHEARFATSAGEELGSTTFTVGVPELEFDLPAPGVGLLVQVLPLAALLARRRVRR